MPGPDDRRVRERMAAEHDDGFGRTRAEGAGACERRDELGLALRIYALIECDADTVARAGGARAP